MSSLNPFLKAERTQLFARLAIDGPTGSGKTWSALEVASVFARHTGSRIAFIDTESGSAKLYADRFDFDVLEWRPPYDPRRLATMIAEAASKHGYQVIVVDSMTHFWTGEGGVLDIVEESGRKSGGGNRFAGWTVGTPAQREMIETFLRVPAHVITTMRSKMEYVLVEDDRGRKTPQKIGMAPEQRAGVEYEFTIVLDMDLDHKGVVSKSRCHDLDDQLVQPGKMGDFAETFAAWLGDGAALAGVEVSGEFLERLNALPDHLRVDAKQEFGSRFGRPDQLRADSIDEAEALVAGYEAQASPDPIGPPLDLDDEEPAQGLAAVPDPDASEDAQAVSSEAAGAA